MKKNQLNEITEVPKISEEVTETQSKEVEEVPYGNSFGQSAGLKDDLDVEDDGVGNKYKIFLHNYIHQYTP